MVRVINKRYDHLHKVMCGCCGSMLAFALTDVQWVPNELERVGMDIEARGYIVNCPNCGYNSLVDKRRVQPPCNPNDMHKDDAFEYYTQFGDYVGSQYGSNPICFEKAYTKEELDHLKESLNKSFGGLKPDQDVPLHYTPRNSGRYPWKEEEKPVMNPPQGGDK